MSLVLSPQARFRWWQADVALMLLAQAGALLFRAFDQLPPIATVAAMVLFELPFAALIALLVTTPANAIRLSPSRSQRIIVAGTLIMQSLSIALRSSPTAHIAIPSLTFAAAVLGVIILARRRISPWWIVPLVWNPLLLARPFS